MLKNAIRFLITFVSRLYTLFILLSSDPFDVSERWFKMNYNPPFWVFLILLSIAIVSALLWAVRDIKKQSKEADYLNDIKSDLITLDKYERETATKKAQNKIPINKKDKIKNDIKDFIATKGLSLFTDIESLPAKEQILDRIIQFFTGIGDIFDANEHGLKSDLLSNAEYTNAKEDIANKQLILRKKKRIMIQTHIRKAMLLTYGLNSVIMFRRIYRSSPDFQKTIPIQYNMMVDTHGQARGTL